MRFRKKYLDIRFNQMLTQTNRIKRQIYLDKQICHLTSKRQVRSVQLAYYALIDNRIHNIKCKRQLRVSLKKVEVGMIKLKFNTWKNTL